MNENIKNIVIALGLSVLFVTGWYFFGSKIQGLTSEEPRPGVALPQEMQSAALTAPEGKLGETQKGKEGAVVGYSKNLSVGGICFVSKAPLAIGQHLSAEIVIPELGEPVAVVGEVVRVKDLEPGKHEIALRFLPFGMDEETRNRLELFIFDHFL